MINRTKIVKSLVAVLLGLELGLILSALVFLSLVAYVVTGIMAYLVVQYLPLDHAEVVNFFSVLLVIGIVAISIYFCLSLVGRYYSQFKWLALGIPLVFGLVYLLFFLPVDKMALVNKELQKHQFAPEENIVKNKKLALRLENRLTQLTKVIDRYSNGYEELFGWSENEVRNIKVDQIFRSPIDTLALCVFTSSSEEGIMASTVFFNPETLKVFAGSGIAAGWGHTREDALTELYYDLYVTNKIRTRTISDSEDKVLKEEVQSILDGNYWVTTINEDTARLYEREVF